MSRVCPAPKTRPRLGALQALLLAASAAGVAAACPANAQQLRGSVWEDPADAVLLDNQTTEDTGVLGEPPVYVPVSPGAVPDLSTLDGTSEQVGASSSEITPAEPAQPENTAVEADQTPTGTVRAASVDSQNDLPLDEGAERVEAIEGLERTIEDRPFDPPGIRMGTFILKPTLEQGVTATSNADSSATGESAVLSETILRLNAASDWATNSAVIDAYGIYRKTISGDEVEDGSGGVDAVLEFDLGNDYRATGRLGYAIAPESATSPVVIVGAASEPLRQTLTGSLELEKDVGKARFGVTGGVDRNSYGDAELEGGGTLSQRDRNATLYSVALRAGYEISPAITPFVEAEIGRNIYDMEFDTAGYARSSDELGVRGGLAVDFSEKLSGEFSAGWIYADFDDPRLETISAPSVGADLEWSPFRGTIVGLSGSTTLEGTTTPDESGSILYSSGLSIEREMRANLTGNAVLGAAWRDYWASDEHDLILNADASLTWWLNRYAGLTTRARHERVTSNVPGRDVTTNSIFLGLKLQRETVPRRARRSSTLIEHRNNPILLSIFSPRPVAVRAAIYRRAIAR